MIGFKQGFDTTAALHVVLLPVWVLPRASRLRDAARRAARRRGGEETGGVSAAGRRG